jgi:hypothetical protein
MSVSTAPAHPRPKPCSSQPISNVGNAYLCTTLVAVSLFLEDAYKYLLSTARQSAVSEGISIRVNKCINCSHFGPMPTWTGISRLAPLHQHALLASAPVDKLRTVWECVSSCRTLPVSEASHVEHRRPGGVHGIPVKHTHAHEQSPAMPSRQPTNSRIAGTASPAATSSRCLMVALTVSLAGRGTWRPLSSRFLKVRCCPK